MVGRERFERSTIGLTVELHKALFGKDKIKFIAQKKERLAQQRTK